MKKFLIALLALFVIIGIALFVLLGKMDGFVKETIETEGSAAIGTPVKVGAVITSLKNGSAVIRNLTIANPAGYKAKHAIEISEFSASVDYKSQAIDNIEINQPIINAEQIGQKNNFSDLLDNMPTSEEVAEEETTEDDTVITINQIALRRATINLVTSELAVAGETIELGDRSFVMDDFVLNKLSGTVTDITDKVVQGLTEHVSSQVKNYLKKEIGNAAKEKLIEKAKEKVNEQLQEKLGDELSGQLGEQLKGQLNEENTDKLSEKLKGLKFKFGQE